MPVSENHKKKLIHFSQEEWSIVEEKAKKLNMKTGTYIQKISVEGKVLIINTPEHRDVLKELHRISSSYNQMARRLNETGSVYCDDIEYMKKEFEEICHMLNVYLSPLRQQEV